MELTVIQERQDGRKTYAPALLQVAGVSQFNDADLRFTGVDGFWHFGDMAARDTGGQVPPVGTIGWFKLAGGNPKRGANARPGSVYLDVESFQRATDEEKTSYTPPSMSPQVAPPPESYSAPPQASGGTSVDMDRKIGQAGLNHDVAAILSGILAGGESAQNVWDAHSEYPFAHLVRLFDTATTNIIQGGRLPYDMSHTVDSGAVEDAAQIEQQAQQHLADNPAWPAPEQPQQSVDTEQLPW